MQTSELASAGRSTGAGLLPGLVAHLLSTLPLSSLKKTQYPPEHRDSTGSIFYTCEPGDRRSCCMEWGVG